MAEKKTISPDLVRERLSYDPETGLLTWRMHIGRIRPGTVAGHLDTEGYLRVTINNVWYYGHRLVWLHHYGPDPGGEIDHVDGDRINNRISNLRIANRSQNSHNSPYRPKRLDPSIPKGVTFRDGRYRSRIRVNGQLFLLGSFDTAEQAHAAYVAAAEKYAGEFANGKFGRDLKVDWQARARHLEALLIQNGIALDSLPEALESGARE